MTERFMRLSAMCSFVIFAGTLAYARPFGAKTPYAYVESHQGPIEVNQGNLAELPTLDSLFAPGKTVSTMVGARLRIILANNSLIILDPQTKLKFLPCSQHVCKMQLLSGLAEFIPSNSKLRFISRVTQLMEKSIQYQLQVRNQVFPLNRSYRAPVVVRVNGSHTLVQSSDTTNWLTQHDPGLLAFSRNPLHPVKVGVLAVEGFVEKNESIKYANRARYRRIRRWRNFRVARRSTTSRDRPQAE